MDVAHVREALRLYASLSPAQQRALWEGKSLPVAQMTPAQRQLFLTALTEYAQGRSTPLDLAQWTNGSLSLTSDRLVRITERTVGPGSISESTSQQPDSGPGTGAQRGNGPTVRPSAPATGPGTVRRG